MAGRRAARCSGPGARGARPAADRSVGRTM